MKIPRTQNYPRRFIAGTACMQCKERDVTVIYSKDHLQYSECIKCGFTQSQEAYIPDKSGKTSNK